jgi:hypothetical protein
MYRKKSSSWCSYKKCIVQISKLHLQSIIYLVQRSHGSTGRRNDIVDKEEERVLRAQVNPLSNQEVELANSQIRGNQVLLLVKVSDARSGRFLHNHLVNNFCF